MPLTLGQEQLNTFFASAQPVVFYIIAEHRAELFLRIRIGHCDALLLGDQHLRFQRHIDFCPTRQLQRRLADRFRIGAAIFEEKDLAQALRFFVAHKIRAVSRKQRAHLRLHWRIDDNLLLGSAGDAIVEGLARDDVANRLLQISRFFDERRTAANTADDHWLSGALRFVDHPRHASDHHERRRWMVHKLARAGFRHRVQIGERALWQTSRRCSLDEDVEHAGARPLRARMRRKQDGIAALDRDQRVVDCRRHRARRRCQTHEHPQRHADVVKLALLVAVGDADAFHTGQLPRQRLCDKTIFHQLILPVAVVCFICAH